MIGGISKTITTLILFPLTLIRTRQQQFDKDLLKKSNLDTKSIAPKWSYRNFISTILLIYQHESIKGFYKGLLPTLMRQIPTSLLFFYGYEYFREILTERLHNYKLEESKKM